VLLLGGTSDRELCRKIAAGIGPSALDLAGVLTLRQSVEALRRCALLVTNDSAPTHLGVAAGIRVLTLFGSTIPEYGFAPQGPLGQSLGIEIYCRPCTDHGRQDCPERHFRCMREITPDRVFAEVKQMLP
jgi:heptosyltransferase II